MVTALLSKRLADLNLALSEAESKLRQLECAKLDAECAMFRTKATIADILEKMLTEALPTGLYNKGYRLKVVDDKTVICDREGEEVYSFNQCPSLGDLMDLQSQLLLGEYSCQNTLGK